MLINCHQCNKEFNRKPSELNKFNFCSYKCNSDYKKLQNIDEKKLNKFIKSRWNTMNIRCGKYKHLQTKNKCKVYENIIIEFSRDQFKTWCIENKDIILSLQRPSIDRIDSSKNYNLDNIRVIELIKNVQQKRIGNTYLNGPRKNIIRGYRKIGSKWTARITINKITTHLGTFNTESEAQEAFKKAYFQHYGRNPY